ncbi:unnamed protein product [Rotaria sp. Silwood2]|nr:unnamed protein product [Rotaria sp. Silwood2]CAF2680410.1 unnamed protein product [Rotaria sp. Silwood2]CAF3918803.1 unnamed protein product [Rotaria sp. Silwood2]CAF3955081.1 unnamed protein product [Rotaria sp. Silwood2]
MAQVRRPRRYRSPPPQKIPSLSRPIRIQLPTRNNKRPTTQTTGPFVENNVSHNQQHNPSNGLMTSSNNFDQSFLSINSSSNQIQTHDKQPLSSENNPPMQNNNNTVSEESMILLTMNDNIDGFLDKKHLPAFARFPLHVPLLPQRMETNVEDNIHKLRLRLIDSELNHQRRSTDDYINRTQKTFSLSSPTSTDYYVNNVRPPSILVHQQVLPKILSRQTSLSILSVATSSSSSRLSRGNRIGIENDVQNNSNIERDLEILRIENSLNKPHRSNQPLTISNYSYDPRLHLQTLQEKQLYSSSNMDDLIDSMARRHLAYRRLDAAIDRQRRTNGYHGPYIEPLNTTGRTSHRSPQRNDHLLHTNRTVTNQNEHDISRINPNTFSQRLRSRIDYYNRIQPDPDSLVIDDPIHTSSYTKLPPISPGYDSNHFNHLTTPLTPSFYGTKHDSHIHQHHQRTIPLGLSDQSEHLIELPSDIFLTSRTDALNSSSQHNLQTHKIQSRSISKDNRSNVENEMPSASRQRSRYRKNSQNDHHDFLVESIIHEKKKPKYHRNLFKKTAIGILFTINLKNRAIKKRSHRLHQSPSALIHKIRLQEIIVALHRVYLEPDSTIHNALIHAINNSISLQNGLNRSSKNCSEAIQIIRNTLQIVISKITELMPKDGVLGTEKNSAVSALIQNGNPFPENYFWQCERELLEFDHLKVINITNQQAKLLLIGIFIFRALITTLLLKPVKYRLILGHLTSHQSANLKVLASVMLYIGRRAVGSKSHILPLPHEWHLSLYTDLDIEAIIQHSEINSTINTCEQSLRMWCEEYIRRIDANFGKELRI